MAQDFPGHSFVACAPTVPSLRKQDDAPGRSYFFRFLERGPMGSGWNGPSRISR